MKLNEQQIIHLASRAKEYPHKDGHLYKKSGKRNTLPDHNTVRWQKRWCIIYCNMMFYFENKESSKPQGVIFLEGVYSAQTPAADQNMYCFNIGTPSDDQRRFLFGCETEGECEEWIKAIIKASFSHLTTKSNSLQDEIDKLKADREKLRQEVADQWSQIGRLKSQLSVLRNQADGVKTKRVSLTDSLKGSSSSGSVVVESPFQNYTHEDIQKIIKIQAFFRSRLNLARWKVLVKNFLKKFSTDKLLERNKLLWQFITAEEDFVLQMTTLVTNFLAPFRNIAYVNNNAFITREEVAQIFINSEAILVLHQIFIKGMETRMQKWPAVHIDDLLFAVKTAVPIYIEYIRNHPNALKVLAECKKRKPFLKVLTFYEAKRECHGQTLEQFLYYPIRVIPNYIRIIHSILKYTPEDHAERDSLQDILQKLQEAQCYNHYLDEGESLRHTLEIERLIEGGCHTLLGADQKFVRHGVLKQVSLGTKFPSGKHEKIRHCFLFSQHLIIGSRTAEGRIRLSKQFGMIPLHSATLIEELSFVQVSSYDEHNRSLMFKLTSNNIDTPAFNELSVILMAAKSNEKALWTSDISQCIFNLSLEDSVEDEISPETVDNNVIPEESTDIVVTNINLPLKEDARLRENSEDIKYSDEVAGPYELPTINYASVERLIERLADPRLPGAEFMETFLLTYKAFTTSQRVMDGLINAYWNVMGGKLSPRTATSLDRKKKKQGSTKSDRRRYPSVLSNSSFSDSEDLERSFSTNSYPCTSTTVFNYHTLKEQLNSPTLAKDSTSKWCEDMKTNNTDNSNINKLRSISACDIINKEVIPVKKLSRSQSVEVIIQAKIFGEDKGKKIAKYLSYDDLDRVYCHRVKPEFVFVSNTKSSKSLPHIFVKPPFERRDDSDLQFRVEIDDENMTVNDNYLKSSRPGSFLENHDLLSESYQSTIVNEESEPSMLLNNHIIRSSRNDENDDIEFFENVTNRYIESLPQNQVLNDIALENASLGTESMKSYENQDSDGASQANEVNMDDDGGASEVSFPEQTSYQINSSTPSLTGESHSTEYDYAVPSADNSILESDDYNYDLSSRLDDDERFSTRSDTINSVDLDRNNTFSSIASNTSMETSGSVPHSYSDELISKHTENMPTPIKSGSLDQKRSLISPYFRKRKEKKKEKKEKTKSRSGSAASNLDVPVLLNYKENISLADLERSGSELDISTEKKPLGEVSSNPLPEKLNLEKKISSTPPRRKRSTIFSGSFPFRLNPLKRASSEQMLTINDMMRMNTSDSSLKLNDNKDTVSLYGNQPSVYGSMTSVNETKSLDSMSINEDSMKENISKPKKKLEKSLLRRKKTKSSPSKILGPAEVPKEEVKTRRRKISVMEAGRPAIIPRKSISINRGPLKIMSIFKHWIAKHPKDFVTDPDMLQSLENFFNDIKEDPRTLPVVKEIVSSLEKTLDAHRKSLVIINPIDELLLQHQAFRNSCENLTELEENTKEQAVHTFIPKLVAENMTLLEHHLYAKISFHEFISCQWTKKDKAEKAPGIMKFIARFNKITNIISYSVVSEENPSMRANIIEFWIKVAAHCRDLNNFNAITEIVSALHGSSVHRLKKSWELVPRPVRHIFTDLESLVSAERSFKNLREAVHMCNPPCVPYLGCYLSDILFVHDGGPTYDNDGLVNYSKMCRIARLVREVKCYQQLPYTLDINKEVVNALVNFDVDVNEDMLYDLSLQHEPRGS